VLEPDWQMMLDMVHDRTATGVTRGLHGCCTAMWKADGKTVAWLLFLDSLYPKTETCKMIRLEVNYYSNQIRK
jgi:hypothetical protein